ncbi:unnamed protein product [Moneuplotes crassus]|uniref:Niemann-Pick C1 N-terminal domain-containing protein n=1 Tax=Euplotes crassus TaxID=5936 RepID=A0AAD1UT90_EUPCR|nr:unnamed protein product [Moneuplotes crassus]
MTTFWLKNYKKFLLVWISLLSLISFIICEERLPKCSFTQSCIREPSQKGTPCPDPSNSETPVAQVGFPKMPTTSRKYLAEACPYLLDQELCCNDDQILVMYNNFKTIDSLFGNCLICSINLKRFWCEYTCSPYQFYFLDSHSQVRVDDVDYPVLNQTMRMGNDVACGIFESCKKNPFVASLASGQSAPGFLEFMGSNAVQTGKIIIFFVKRKWLIDDDEEEENENFSEGDDMLGKYQENGTSSSHESVQRLINDTQPHDVSVLEGRINSSSIPTESRNQDSMRG